MAEKETVFEVNRLILDQTNDLWLIATGLIVFQVFLIAYVIRSTRSEFSTNSLAWFLSTSATFYALSLMFGYLAKGALISAMIDFAESGKWSFTSVGEVMNLMQVACVTLGLLVFIVAFVRHSRLLARAVTHLDIQ